MNDASLIHELYGLVPSSLKARSGKVFYSGRAAFRVGAPFYLLGLNPGGAPEAYPDETVESHSLQVLQTLPEHWSAYRDESWAHAAPGTWQMQPRVRHFFRALNIDPASVPASNLVFSRTRDEEALKRELSSLIEACWRFHLRVIERTRATLIVCLGQTCGEAVQDRVGAHHEIDAFEEDNGRKWRSAVFRATSGLRVAVLTHPSRVKWQEPKTDPTPLIARALERT
jgi:hypothetical protein